MSNLAGEEVDWAVLESQFPEDGLVAAARVEEAAKDPVVRLMVEAHVQRIVDLPHEDWEWLGKVIAAGYRISRDGAAEAIALSEQAFKNRMNGGTA